MNATALRQVPQQLSVAARAGIAIAAVALITGGIVFADEASEQAAHNALAAISPAIRYVVLPNVEVVAKKVNGEIADSTCAAPQAKI